MSSKNNTGDTSPNRIIISKGGDMAPRKLDPDTNITDRSFAQPNPNLPEEKLEPKAHASAQDEAEALKKHSSTNRSHSSEDQDDEQGSE